MSSLNHQVGHFEIPADNVDNLKNFYSSLFSWQFEKGEKHGYWIIKNAGISGAIAQKENPEQISTQFVIVESIEDYINKAKQLGATLVKNKQEISEGYYAVLEDPQKNTFGIWQNK
ncbi:MAG TPA: VOC family protein [Nitrososphaeraceae archaeon]|nr:VOC family protein [Nitrososphaeraceae archaeon]